MVMAPVRRQEMVVEHVGHHWRIMPEVRSQPLLAAIHHGMGVGEVVNGAVQLNASSNAGAKTLPYVPSLHKITNKIAHHDFGIIARSEEHTSELQSRENLVCRLLLEKKKWR